MLDTAELPDDIAALKAMLVAAALRDQRKDERIAQLEKLVAAFKQAAFGRRSEKSDPDQFELALEDLETAIAAVHAEDEAEDRAARRPAKRRSANRGSLPKHLPRIEEIIEPESLVCGCGGGLHCIGEDVSERLDVIPAQFRVIVTRRPKYACRSCTDGVVQAPAPARLSEICGGFAKDLVGLTQLPVLSLQRLELLGHIRRHAGTLATVDLGLLHPVVQGVRRTADLLGNRNNGSPARRILTAVLQHHPHRPGSHLGGKLVRCLAHQALSYLGVRASDSPGAVQTPWPGGSTSRRRTPPG